MVGKLFPESQLQFVKAILKQRKSYSTDELILKEIMRVVMDIVIYIYIYIIKLRLNRFVRTTDFRTSVKSVKENK